MRAVVALRKAVDTAPTEFRIFTAGWNDTEKGRFLFDETAAACVLAHARRHGVDKMIDLEHLSLEPEAQNFDPNARGWFKLEVRKGELWAVNVRWTPDGERRLRERTQRYISPTFDYDPETRRVLRLFNAAITAVPATHRTPSLVAASTRESEFSHARRAQVLTDRELRICRAEGCSPVAFAIAKSRQLDRTNPSRAETLRSWANRFTIRQGREGLRA